jgi:putative two-component system hydrogenase maturation factor HypX/HoxX
LYGAHIQPLTNYVSTPPKTILAIDKQAILLSCADNANAIWITHLKDRLHQQHAFKLPAAQVLPPTPCHMQDYPLFQDIHVNIKDDVCYVEWEFYNGAMRDDHCYRLKQMLKQKINSNIKVVVLLGGHRYFSNGIDLNTIEAAKDPVAQSQKYIHAINDLIQYIMMDLSDKIVISVLRGHAGAGGAMMSQAADFVFINENSLVNPHYRTMGLHGSECWTFNLPSRLGSLSQANSLVNSLRPLNAQQAVTSGFADFSYSTLTDVEQMISNQILPNIDEQLKWKASKRKENILKYGQPEACFKRELKIMNENFHSYEYNRARYQFVRKIPLNTTPFHLLALGQKQATIMKGQACAAHIYNQIKTQYQQQSNIRIPITYINIFVYF